MSRGRAATRCHATTCSRSGEPRSASRRIVPEWLRIYRSCVAPTGRIGRANAGVAPILHLRLQRRGRKTALLRSWKLALGPVVVLALFGAAPTFAAQSPQRPLVLLYTTYEAPAG